MKTHQNDVMVRMMVQEFIPPADVVEEAVRGLALRAEFGRGGTEIGVGMAQLLSSGKPVSAKTIQRMYSYFCRHEVDKRGKNFFNPEKPSNGFIAWLLWGGDKGWEWAKMIRQELTHLIER